jgi:hypothetical protein
MPIFIPQVPGPDTSHLTVLNVTTNQIVNAALRMVGAYASTDNARPEQQADAIEALNLMLKAWQTESFIWLPQFVTLNMVQGQAEYTIGPDSADTIKDEDGVTFTERPTHIRFATRRTSSGQEIEMTQLGRIDYQRLPNKTSQGTPIQYYYSPQTNNGKIYVWPTPSNSTDQVVLSVDRNLQTMVSDINSFDLPQEWLQLIKYGLACVIAPEYGIAIGERQLLERDFAMLKESASAYNRENTSTFLQINRN